VPEGKGCGCSTQMLVGTLVLLLVLFVVSFISGALGASFLGDLGMPSFLSVPKPHPQIPAEEVFHLFGFPVTNTLVASWLTMLVLIGLFYAGTRKMKLIPGKLQNFMEMGVEMLLNFVEGVAGKENGRRFFPLIATIFLFVIMNAWLSLFPGFGTVLITGAEEEPVHLLRGANTDINLPLTLALMSFIFVEYWGITSRGFRRYMSKFINLGGVFRSMGQILKGKLRVGLSGLFSGAIDAFVGILEALSEVVRVVSFTFRLFGNMTAGEILVLLTLFLVPWVLPIPFYGLEMLVGFVQALIFAGLTLVFAIVAVAAEAEHG